MEEDNYQRLRDYSLRLLSFRPRSVKEISDKLKKYSSKRDIPQDLIDKIIRELKEEKYLDDKEFTNWWRQKRQSYKPKGKKAIRIELLQKGIDKKIIEESLTSADSEFSEYDLAMKAISKKLNFWKHLSSEKLKVKIRDFLLRRGFDWETIYKVIDEFTKKE